MAIQIIREVSADVVKRGSTRAVYAKQHDKNSRFLNVRIQEDGTDITVDATSEVMLNVERSDKQTGIFYGTVNEDGTVKIPLTSWMLELAGTLLCDVSIVAEDIEVAKLTTMQFNIYVEEAVVSDEAITDAEEYSVIVDLLKRTEEACEKSEAVAAAVEACETATAAAQQAAAGVVTIEQNGQLPLKFWMGTQAQYDAIATKDNDTLYFIKDGSTIGQLYQQVQKILNGTTDIIATSFKNTDDELVDFSTTYPHLSTNCGTVYDSGITPFTSSSPAGLYFLPVIGAFFIHDGKSVPRLYATSIISEITELIGPEVVSYMFNETEEGSNFDSYIELTVCHYVGSETYFTSCDSFKYMRICDFTI